MDCGQIPEGCCLTAVIWREQTAVYFLCDHQCVVVPIEYQRQKAPKDYANVHQRGHSCTEHYISPMDCLEIQKIWLSQTEFDPPTNYQRNYPHSSTKPCIYPCVSNFFG
ncbi:WD40 domain-containing protein [Trifolium repens]|nr:WD40 domain-containing protein [Trifolium repens]